MGWWGARYTGNEKIAKPDKECNKDWLLGNSANYKKYRIVNEAGELIDVQYLPEGMPWKTSEERQPVRQNERGQETWVRKEGDAVRIKCYSPGCAFTLDTEYCHANPVIDRLGRCLSFQIISGDCVK